MSERFWSELARQLEPYTPGEQPQLENLLKLNTNESPYPPAPGVLDAIRALDADELRRYPDPDSSALRRCIAQHHGLAPTQVFVGNGSDEVLAHAFAGLLKHPRELLFPDLSYSFYPVWCQLHGLRYRRVPLRDDFRIEPDDYSAEAAAVIIPNPNAPTGRLLALAELEKFLRQAPQRLLLVDEAYIDFGGHSALALLADYANLLIVQTLSKSRALAGLRVGLALGPAPLIAALERVKNSFNSYPLDRVAQRAALAAYADREWFETCRRRVIECREWLACALRRQGFEVAPSAANFLFVRHAQIPGVALFQALRARGILVRRWDKPRIEDYLRISIGTREECERLVATIAAILAEGIEAAPIDTQAR